MHRTQTHTRLPRFIAHRRFGIGDTLAPVVTLRLPDDDTTPPAAGALPVPPGAVLDARAAA